MNKLMFLILVLSLGGCASAVGRHEQLQAHLVSPVDCINADNEIASLQSEKVSKREAFLNGLASLWPSSALLNIATGEFSSRVAIANGKFNKQVESRIQDIHDSCDGTIVARS